MQVTTATKTVTTRTHHAVFSGDDVKGSLLSIAKKGVAGLTDEKVASSKVDIAADGTVTVEIVEQPDETAPTAAVAAAPVATPAAAPVATPAAAPVATPAAAATPVAGLQFPKA